MSAVEDSQRVWANISKENLDSKYEKCRNIAEEIYKRIDITFQIKKLETATQSELSEHSDQIDSNELSNETDLFACDKSDSLPSSTEPEKPTDKQTDKYSININNNNEDLKVKPIIISKRPRKRLRKRVKKHQPRVPDSDGSSDEAAPLSRMVVKREPASPDRGMGVPRIVIVTRDLKPKILTPDNKAANKKTKDKPIESPTKDSDNPVKDENPANIDDVNDELPIEKGEECNIGDKNCSMCRLSFRGERGLRRHMKISHLETPQEDKKQSKDKRQVKPK